MPPELRHSGSLPRSDGLAELDESAATAPVLLRGFNEEALGFVRRGDVDPAPQNPHRNGSGLLNHPGRHCDVGLFAQNIKRALTDNCVGFTFAINLFGELSRKGSGGLRQLGDDPDDNLPSRPHRKMHIASVTKNLTAIAVVKAAHERGVVLKQARLKNFLPSQWQVSDELKHLTLHRLLQHTSGFDKGSASTLYPELRSAMEAAKNWDADLYAQQAFAYDNRNFGLMRIVLPYLVCPQVMTDVEIKGHAAGNYHQAVDKATQDLYKMLMRHYVFLPLGMTEMDCKPEGDHAGRTMCYMWPNPEASQAQDGGDWTAKSGGAGWVMSARQLAKLLRFRRYSHAFMKEELRDRMDAERYGWLTINGAEGTYLYHGGAFGDCDKDGGPPLAGSGPLRSCIMELPYGVEVAVLVNSFVKTCSGSLTRLVSNAFDDAIV